jgi:hypothetical protein
VIVEFSGGGVVFTSTAYLWDGTEPVFAASSAGACAPGGLYSDVCSISNTGNITVNWDYQAKAGGVPFKTVPSGSFIELGVNITGLFAGNTPCFSSFLAETRSSTALTAQLKDFALGTFSLCSVEIVKVCENGRINAAGNGFVWDVRGSVQNTGSGTVFNAVVTDNEGNPLNPALHVADDINSATTTTIAPGAFAFFFTTVQSTTNGLTNNASVVAFPSATSSVQITDETTDLCEPVIVEASIEVVKDCGPTFNPLVDDAAILEVKNGFIVVKIRFNVQVTNPGTSDVPLTNVTVVDDNGTPANAADDVIIIGPTTLAIGETKTFSGFYYPSIPDGPLDPESATFTNTVRAQGTGFVVGTVTDTDTVSCAVCQ